MISGTTNTLIANKLPVNTSLMSRSILHTACFSKSAFFVNIDPLHVTPQLMYQTTDFLNIYAVHWQDRQHTFNGALWRVPETLLPWKSNNAFFYTTELHVSQQYNYFVMWRKHNNGSFYTVAEI